MPNNISAFSPTKLLHHFLGIFPAYFLTTYFSAIYSGFVAFLLISLLFQILCGIFNGVFLSENSPKIDWHNHRDSILILLIASALPLSAAFISWQFPGLFDQRLLIMDVSRFLVFLGLTIISTPLSLRVNRILRGSIVFHTIDTAGFIPFLQTNRAGIMVALLFFITYFIFAQTLNFPSYYTRDQYFEADISDWITRLTARPTDEQLPVRAVHPAVLLFLRPLVWLLSIPLNGDRLQAAFLLSALAGATCVFMIWMIVKQHTDNTTYALISASVLGASTSHLLMSSMLETYIFSALALTSFCFLIQSDKTSLRQVIPMGVVIFGITITNIVQACILYFMKLPRIKVVFQFVLTVVLIVLLLNMLQVQIFPYSKPIYDPSNLLAEQPYRHDPFDASWKFRGRVILISRAILLYGVVSPTPYILTDEIGANVPNFRTFQIMVREFQVAGYRGAADVTVKLWMTILGLAVILFMVNLLRTPKQQLFSISLILCLGFNLVLHILYGDDPMLYSPNWTYAIVLFVSFSFDKWANNKWMQLGLIIFLGMLIYTNLELVNRILSASLPFYGS